MRIERPVGNATKGWFLGPWNATLDAAVGWATAADHEAHLHRRTTEVHLVARGRAEARVERDTAARGSGDVPAVEPGEAHTFPATTADYLRSELHLPVLPEPEARADTIGAPRERVGLARGRTSDAFTTREDGVE